MLAAGSVALIKRRPLRWVAAVTLSVVAILNTDEINRGSPAWNVTINLPNATTNPIGEGTLRVFSGAGYFANQPQRAPARRVLVDFFAALKHQGPSRVLTHLEGLEQRWSLPAIGETLRYLRKRLPQLQYPQFLAAGWPIGSGMVESAHKVVMQARLKGAGMHWESANVNPMLALRNALRNDRWEECWQMQQQRCKQKRQTQRQQRCEQRQTHLLHQFTEQMVRFCLLLPRQTPPAQSSSPKGRTEAQKRWGRQTFSHKALPLLHAKI